VPSATQGSLFDAPQPNPIRPVDPHLTPEEKPRLTRQCYEVLNALRNGPKTNGDFMDMRIARYSARVFDLRAAGYVILTDQDRASGLTTYTLVSEPKERR